MFVSATKHVPTGIKTTAVQRFFINYAFQNTTTVINGIHFKWPQYPPFLFPENPSDAVSVCPDDCGLSGTVF